jgi:hypothetical protein
VSHGNKQIICPTVPELSATCHCQMNSRCHDCQECHISELMIATYIGTSNLGGGMNVDMEL